MGQSAIGKQRSAGSRQLTTMALALLVGLAACRASDPSRTAGDEVPAVTEAAPALEQDAMPENSEPPAELAGFDLWGPASCLPLKVPAETACAPRKSAVAEACTRAKGEIKRCDDCSAVCSVVLAKAPE